MSRGMSDAAERARRLARVREPHVAPINELVDGLRVRIGRDDIPYVDPNVGGTAARLLLLLQDPGGKAAGDADASGLLSWDNDDPTAQMCSELFAHAGIPWADAVPWNAWPWIKPWANRDLADDATLRVTKLLPHLTAVLVLGNEARSQWSRIGNQVPNRRPLRVILGVHPAGRGLTRGSQQLRADGVRQLEAAFADAAAVLSGTTH